MTNSIKHWCTYIANWRIGKGFSTPKTIKGNDADLMLGKLMLVVSEIGEASEAVRKGDIENFKEELADASIRIFDICGTMDIDLELAIELKMQINEQRPIRHGKLTQL